MKDSDQAEAPPAAPASYTPSRLTVSVPAEAVIPNNNQLSPLYPSSELSPTPPPIPMPPFINEDTPSPPPSPIVRAMNIITPRPSTAPLPPAGSPVIHTQQPTHPDEDTPMTNPLDATDENDGVSIRTLVETTHKDSNATIRNAPRDPIDKYTNAVMPRVHDAHPTSPFNFIDLDLVSIWEKFAGGKLLIIPFGDMAHKEDLHDQIKNRILYAMAEIAQSKEVGVSAPTPSAEATHSKRFPSSFLVYNLTKPQKNLILDRGVWSSQAITFRATPFFPTNPDFLFTIKGFSTLVESDVTEIICRVWHDNDTTTFAQSIVDTAPEGDRAPTSLAIRTFLNSMTTKCLNIKERGGSLTPRYNVYADGNSIPRHTTWLDLRKYLANRIYFTPMHGRGIASLNPYNCGICHGVDHPRGLCPFPDIPGWNGPGKNQNTDNRRERNSGQYGQRRLGAGPSLNNGDFRM